LLLLAYTLEPVIPVLKWEIKTNKQPLKIHKLITSHLIKPNL